MKLHKWEVKDLERGDKKKLEVDKQIIIKKKKGMEKRYLYRKID